MAERIRAFLAVELDEACRARLGAYARLLHQRGVKASWVKVANLHITLRFLGEVEPASLDTLVERLAPQYAQVSAFTVSFAGSGVFPARGRPRVLWVGVDDGVEELTQCYDIAAEGARDLKCQDEGSTFSPHVTLGRFRDAKGNPRLESAQSEAGETHAGAMRVSYVSLFSSELNPGGSVYRILRRFPLREFPT